MGWIKKVRTKGKAWRDKAEEAYPRLTKKALSKMPDKEIIRLDDMICDELLRRAESKNKKEK